MSSGALRHPCRGQACHCFVARDPRLSAWLVAVFDSGGTHSRSTGGCPADSVVIDCSFAVAD